ncbi:MAG: alanine dehydrogenase [Chloroflexi bacterium]|nr:alanine dehydrogenase [Chloroflexota bacterium]
MIIGIPKEIKDNEFRVALTPAGAEALVGAGHRVLVEAGAGLGSGFGDDEYRGVGVQIVPSHSDIFNQAEMVAKVKEPLPAEYDHLREGLLLFTFLHLAPAEQLTRALLEKGVTAVAYETVELPDGTLPILSPMSEVAGRMAVQVAAQLLEKRNGGRGKLLGGVPGVAPARVVIVGAGVVGENAARIALGMGAQVTLINRGLDRLRYLSEVLHGNLITLSSTHYNIARSMEGADVLISAVLVTGARAPRLVSREMVRSMGPGAIVIDVAVDQGGCVETSRQTTHSEPTFVVDGVVHYGVANMPGAVPSTSTFALANASLPYILELANLGFEDAVRGDGPLAKGVNVYAGHITYPAVAQAQGLPCESLDKLLGDGGLPGLGVG